MSVQMSMKIDEARCYNLACRVYCLCGTILAQITNPFDFAVLYRKIRFDGIRTRPVN